MGRRRPGVARVGHRARRRGGTALSPRLARTSCASRSRQPGAASGEPGFASGIVLTLALAVGANAAVFTLIDPFFFRDPPGIADVSSVRRLYTVNPRQDGSPHVWRIFSYAEYVAVRQAVDGMARVAVFASRDSMPIGRGADSSFATVSYVTADFLPMLARPARGRFFTAAEDDVHAPADVAVVSERFAARHFGTSVDPVGQTVDVQDRRYTVIGVVPGDRSHHEDRVAEGGSIRPNVRAPHASFCGRLTGTFALHSA